MIVTVVESKLFFEVDFTIYAGAVQKMVTGASTIGLLLEGIEDGDPHISHFQKYGSKIRVAWQILSES